MPWATPTGMSTRRRRLESVQLMSWSEMSDPFGSGGAEAAAKELGIPFLGRVPLDIAIRKASDAGEPPALGEGPIAEAYAAIARQVSDWIDAQKVGAA